MDSTIAATIVVGLVAFVLEFAAWRWGVDSTDGPDSPEWVRRSNWRGYGAPDWSE